MTVIDFSACTIVARDAQRDTLMPHGLPVWYEGGTAADRSAWIDLNGGDYLGLRVSRATIPDGAGGYKGRAQLQLAPGGISSAYGRWQMMLSHAWLAYCTYPKSNRWCCVMTMGMGDPSKDGAFMVSVDVRKPDPERPDLRWYATGEEKIGGRWVTAWEFMVSPLIPIGEWLTIECGYKKGNVSTGRFLWRMNGEDVFSVRGRTYASSRWASWLAPGLTAWQPAKLYLPGALVDHMTARGAVPAIYWRDMQIEERWL